ncbi:TolB family protein [Cohnella abietis]|uniref:Translocation protein TolB n=1 Tax=Cohnella abietis TaxID=2507935 RepID=A0A3T1DDW3_9BACL|nr:PD40 domain-containing protein [Cohnella abietis]BBI36356.1 translocation protein TolB [Cohnella abietis]
MTISRKISLILTAMTLIIWLGKAEALAATPEPALKAAFVRGGDLWIKAGGTETQLTKGEQTIRKPKWSFDGEWIAYTKGQEGRELRLWHVPTGQSHLVSPTGGDNYQWSPYRNHLAFLSEQKLVWVKPDKLDMQTKVAEGINNFSWLPNGSGFIASTTAQLLPNGWTPVQILEISLKKNEQEKAAHTKTLFVLPQMSDDFFAVGTSVFKFSPTGRWIAFLATPTASLSADGNTLCLLGADGTAFTKVDQMLNDSEWFKWSDRADKLAYIGGVGREATSNKQLKVVEAQVGKPVIYTPKGYVDQSFTWEGQQHIVVSRALERKELGSSAKLPLPTLVEVRLQGPQDKPLTQPPKRFGDFNPEYIRQVEQLTWVRSDRSKASVLVSGRSGKHPSVWITNIDLGSNFFEQWRWSDVLSFYS